MKNLFSFATRELSQDAFLRWLFENYDDEDIKPVVRTLLKEFCALEDDEVIKNIKTWAQWCKVDISIEIDTNKRQLALFIEDKAFSNEHDNQLKTYGVHIGNYYDGSKPEKKREIYKIFYKTSLLSDKDKQATIEADWRAYDIDKIYSLYVPFADNENTIVQQYIEYLNELHKAVNNTVKPQNNDCWADWLSWESYFNKIILTHHFKEKFPLSDVLPKGMYPYACLRIIAKDGYPYLEIRSRDCVGGNNPIKIKILCYDVKDLSPQKTIINKIKTDNNGIFECKYIMSKKGHDPKQMAFHYTENIDTDEKFIAEIEKCVDYYSEIIKLWEKLSTKSADE